MKILKQPRKELYVYHGTCDECRLVIECREHEVTWLSDGNGDASACYGIECPHCDVGQWIYLK